MAELGRSASGRPRGRSGRSGDYRLLSAVLTSEAAAAFPRLQSRERGAGVDREPAPKQGRAPTLLVLGDSHIGAIETAWAVGLLQPWRCELINVGGATAVGLRNPNVPKTNAINIFREALQPVRPATVLIHLGEVDCGFVIWYRARKYRESVEAQLWQSIGAYFGFVDEVIATGYPDVIIAGAVLPTIPDGHDWGEVAQARKEVKAPLLERTALTLRYNDILKREATERGLKYTDLTGDLLDPQARTIRPEYRNPDAADHHLHPRLAPHLWARAIRRVLPPV